MPLVRITQEEFVRRAVAKHGNYYSYEKAIYNGTFEKVIIICPIHGEFQQKPSNHLFGRGCKECGTKKAAAKIKLSKEEFIQKANIEHDNFYNYDLVEYKSNRQKVIIICPNHGKFEQIAGDHTNGHGCKECFSDRNAASLQMPFSEFLDKTNKIHNNKYFYNENNYVLRGVEEMIITCPDHGDFSQRRGVHLRGHGCQECAGVKPLTIETIISRSNKVHNNKYDYSQFISLESEYMDIICPNHGHFKQKVQNHINGHGCIQCWQKRMGDQKRLTIEEFVERAQKCHNDTYDYSEVEYIRQDEKVKIICKKHGAFYQTPDNHINDHGCPECFRNRITYTHEEFIEKCAKIYDNFYNYSITKFT